MANINEHESAQIDRANASGVIEIVEMPERGHSLTIDHGWRAVADTALAFVKRFA